MKKIAPVLLSLLFSVSIFSKTIVVTDIDDTIKMSGVKSITRMITNAFNTKVYFKGMPELLKELLTLDNDSKMVYLSNAKRWMMKGSHSKLLRDGHFPKGELILKTKLPSSQHKLAALRKLIKQHSPDTMILIGDIGESDAFFYQTISKEYPSITFHQFIRVIYSGKKFSNKLSKEQIGFVTPIEIATYFNQLNNDNKFDHLIEHVVSDLTESNKYKLLIKKLSRGQSARYFPKWQDCSSFVWPFTKSDLNSGTIDTYLNYLQMRCR